MKTSIKIENCRKKKISKKQEGIIIPSYLKINIVEV